jgi:hypothetical protein
MKVLNFRFGEFEFHDHIIVGTVFQDVHVSLEMNEQLLFEAIKHYGHHGAVGYLSIRKFEYSIDPLVYHRNKRINNLKCIAVVEPSWKRSSTAIESSFFKPGMMQSFSNREIALAWMANRLAAQSIESHQGLEFPCTGT